MLGNSPALGVFTGVLEAFREGLAPDRGEVTLTALRSPSPLPMGWNRANDSRSVSLVSLTQELDEEGEGADCGSRTGVDAEWLDLARLWIGMGPRVDLTVDPKPIAGLLELGVTDAFLLLDAGGVIERCLARPSSTIDLGGPAFTWAAAFAARPLPTAGWGCICRWWSSN